MSRPVARSVTGSLRHRTLDLRGARGCSDDADEDRRVVLRQDTYVREEVVVRDADHDPFADFLPPGVFLLAEARQGLRAIPLHHVGARDTTALGSRVIVVVVARRIEDQIARSGIRVLDVELVWPR